MTYKITLVVIMAVLAFSSHFKDIIEKEWGRDLWCYFLIIGVLILITMILSIGNIISDNEGQKKREKRIEQLQAQIKQSGEEQLLATVALGHKIDNLQKSGERIEGKGTTFLANAVPPIAEYFPLIFKASSGVITGYVRVQGTNEYFRFSTKPNKTIPVAVHNLWLPDKKLYQSPPTVELVIDFQSDEKSELSVFTAGYFLPDGM